MPVFYSHDLARLTSVTSLWGLHQCEHLDLLSNNLRCVGVVRWTLTYSGFRVLGCCTVQYSTVQSDSQYAYCQYAKCLIPIGALRDRAHLRDQRVSYFASLQLS
eukprot:6260075-Pyramimonas_sp.AAC.2